MKTIETAASVGVNISEIPAHQTDTLCRVILGSVARLFEDPAVKADYMRWKEERQKKHRKE